MSNLKWKIVHIDVKTIIIGQNFLRLSSSLYVLYSTTSNLLSAELQYTGTAFFEILYYPVLTHPISKLLDKPNLCTASHRTKKTFYGCD